LLVFTGVPSPLSPQVYQAYADYFDMMDLVEELVTDCAQAVRHTLQFDYQVQTDAHPGDLPRPWLLAGGLLAGLA
jgi:lysyl-tRNA synthetase class II